MTSYAEAIGPARERAASFFRSLKPSRRIVVFCHFDADGLAAGALLGRALQRLRFKDVQVVPAQRGESAFSEQARQRLAALKPSALIVTDLGVDATGVLPNLPTLFIDHHRPEGMPAGATVITGYGWDPIPCSAWLAYELLSPLADIYDLLWIAAIGILGDLGDHAPWEHLPDAKKQYTVKWLREAVSLINASRRASAFDVDTPLKMLLTADHPRAISEDTSLGADRLREYREEVNRELQQARKLAPLFSNSQPFALILLNSACQIHPLIAQQWVGRLRRYVVMAANTGYLPGIVAISARTARRDLALPVLFQSLDLGGFSSMSFGRGHDQASGGQVPPEVFNRLVDALGFDERARVPFFSGKQRSVGE